MRGDVGDRGPAGRAGSRWWRTSNSPRWPGRSAGARCPSPVVRAQGRPRHQRRLGISIPKSSKVPREAFEFAAWCVEKEKQVKFVLETQVSPTRSSVFERPELRDRFIWFPVMKEQLANSFDFPHPPRVGRGAGEGGCRAPRGWAGQYPIPKALDRANQLVVDLLKERKYPVGTWTGPKLPWE